MTWITSTLETADKDLSKIFKKSHTDGEKILQDIDSAESNPLSLAHYKRIKGRGDQPLYRLRSGQYRIIAKITEHNQHIQIIRIIKRDTAYKDATLKQVMKTAKNLPDGTQ